ncbi:3-oxoacyl-[acyl-carrier-protein] synthase-3 [Clostridium cavendishii DSM 21758]|uniref:Beta-ketoacyl-[acyl-carrier-protein] synthase III n=1 Tax=Clostridium cavendishii DSM 21758 TaxID=1121302 RepID=A0A1M6KHZ4_9CLOT|nr:beta-ketoacyl-ACP synthase III [Clostridium cavendishii]SHJ58545.1 3-oxoacyl-[acyl-carrier-protein] synthase-3 [Clostridium cavendishii DSM 21758]
MINSKIVGLGAYVPSNIVTNDKLSEFVDTSDEWILTRTGIKERRVSIDEDTSELATRACIEALKNASIKADDVDHIIVATVSPDMFCPSVSCIVQNNIGAVNASALDINAACSGFLYGVKLANSLIKSGEAKIVLVVGAETLSKVTDWTDRRTCVLFGDAAGAAVIKATEENGIMAVHTMAEGDKWNALKIDGIPVRNPFVKAEERAHYISMNGQEVFRFATRVIVEATRKVLKKADLNISDITYIIPHQANLRIIDYASKKLGFPIEKFYINLDRYGNTSSASVPLALYEMFQEGKLKKGDKIILVGFGGGLTYGATLIEW